jgi:hypothetical protein
MNDLEIHKPPEDALIYSRRGRFIGGVLALLLTVFFPGFVYIAEGWRANVWDMIKVGLSDSLEVALVTVPVGMYLGYKASRYQTTTSAFLQGALISGLIAIIPFIPLFLITGLISRHTWFPLSLLAIFVTEGALVSGVAAIYVRDYWKFKRKRWLPQFSLREMLICFTLMSVVIAFFTVLTCLK